jgi:hypothetical protein
MPIASSPHNHAHVRSKTATKYTDTLIITDLNRRSHSGKYPHISLYGRS